MFSQDRWRHKGHPLGQCIVSPTGEHAMVCVPKNSSSYWKTWLVDHMGWALHTTSQRIGEAVHIIPLRDPVDRWLTGVSEYFVQYFDSYRDEFVNTNGFDRLVEDRVVFDDHTECQSYFIAPFSLPDAVFFLHSNTEGVWQYLENHGYRRPKQRWLHNPINFTEDPVNANRKAWKKYFEDSIDLNNISSYYNTYDKFTIKKLSQINDNSV